MLKEFVTESGFRYLAESQEQAERMSEQDGSKAAVMAAMRKPKQARNILVRIESEAALYSRREAEANAYRGVKAETAAYAGMPEGAEKIYAKRAAEAQAHRATE